MEPLVFITYATIFGLTVTVILAGGTTLLAVAGVAIPTVFDRFPRGFRALRIVATSDRKCAARHRHARRKERA